MATNTEKQTKKSASPAPRKRRELAEQKIQLPVVDAAGKEVGTREVSAAIFGVRPNLSLLHQVVRWQRAKKRAGTHAVQTRAEMTGGGAKPWKQKGTGRARAGSNTSPVWVGGGIAHGPKPRSYEFQLNSKERKAALCGALSARAVEGGVILLNDFALNAPKTKDADKILRAIGVKKGAKAVVVLDPADESSQKSLRNIEKVTVLKPAGLNVYDLINAHFVIFTTKGLDQVEARLSK